MRPDAAETAAPSHDAKQVRLRWIIAIVLFTSSTLNYLDRATLNALGPTIIKEFSLNLEQFGYLISAFNLIYAFAAPVMGLMIDRLGLRIGAALAVGLWSIAGMSTALAQSFGSLMAARAALGFAEAGGIPATAKGSAVYLEPKDRALGSAVSQIGLSVGIILAPLLTTAIASSLGWRAAFVIFGAAGFLWIPVWLAMSRLAPEREPEPTTREVNAKDILRDPRFLALIGANILAMTIYSLWTNWTTLFFVTQYGLQQNVANVRFAWVSPIFGSAGGLVGGWLAQRAIQRGSPVVASRMRIALFGALGAAATGLAPLAPSPELAVAAMSISFFSILVLSVNYYSIPLDLFGPARAGFAVSFLTSAFGLMQVLLSPLIGRWCERYGWKPVCALIAVMPLLSWILLQQTLRRRS
jgi:MFS transporter, ACS family, hexuronate transporter